MFHSFEHKILKKLKESSFKETCVFICCSGGKDSMALLELFSSLKKTLKLEIFTIHISHGFSKNVEQDSYREKVLDFVKDMSEKKQALFLSNKKEDIYLKSESDLRAFRYEKIQNLIASLSLKKPYWIALGHHSQDLLETRLIRLIRGTGVQGLESMKEWNAPYFRPLLCEDENEIKKYLVDKKVPWMEDPSNKDLEVLRNWIRHDWLVRLEERKKGSVYALSRSLELLNSKKALSIKKSDVSCVFLDEGGLDTRKFLSLHYEEKKYCLVTYLYKKGIKNYTQSHILEILKRLESPRKCKSFKVLNCHWRVDESKIFINH